MDFPVPNFGGPLMDALVAFTSVLRLVLVSLVFALNCYALFKVCFRSILCMHNMVSTAVILANLIYLVTWPPFIVYSLTNGSWSLLNEQVYCLSQNYVVNAMGMVLVSLLTVRMCDRVRETVFRRPSLTGAQNATITFLMWILPQLLYDVVSLTDGHRLCGRSPVFRFLGDIVRVVPRDSDAGYALGFMVCQQELTAAILSVHVWQYLVIVLPLATMVIVGILMQVVASLYRRPQNRMSTLWTPLGHGNPASGFPVCRMSCQRRMVVVDLILCSNLFWHLIGRPLMLLHALLYRDHVFPVGFLDIGSHLMLAISCVFIPTVCAKLVRSRRDVIGNKPPLVGVATDHSDILLGNNAKIPLAIDDKMADFDSWKKIAL